MIILREASSFSKEEITSYIESKIKTIGFENLIKDVFNVKRLSSTIITEDNEEIIISTDMFDKNLKDRFIEDFSIEVEDELEINFNNFQDMIEESRSIEQISQSILTEIAYQYIEEGNFKKFLYNMIDLGDLDISNPDENTSSSDPYADRGLSRNMFK